MDSNTENQTTDSWPYSKILKYILLPKPKGSPSAGKKEILSRVTFGLAGLVVLYFFWINPTPKCSDESTLKLVSQIIYDNYILDKKITKKSFDDNVLYEFARATAIDKSIKKTSCTANIIFNKSYKLPIFYDSQVGDDKSQIVSVGEVRVADIVAIETILNEAISKNNPLTKSITPVKKNESFEVEKKNTEIINSDTLKDTNHVETIGGSLDVIKNGEFYGTNILINNNRILTDDVMSVEILKKYHINNQDIVLISIGTGANGACPVDYIFITISTTDVTKSPEISCHNEAELETHVEGSKIIGVIPNEERNDIYIYDNGLLTENGILMNAVR